MAQLSTTALATDANIQGYYRFESGALTTDSSGQGRTLTSNGSPSETTGKYGGGVDFGAANTASYYQVSNAMGYNGGSCTFTGWLNLDTEISTGNYHFLLVDDNTTSQSEMYLRYQYNGGTRRLDWGRYKNPDASGTDVFYNVALGTGTYHYVTGTYGANNLILYYEGNPVGTTSQSGNGSGDLGTTRFLVGRHPSGQWLCGKVDDVAVFNRALTASEVLTLYQDAVTGLLARMMLLGVG